MSQRRMYRSKPAKRARPEHDEQQRIKRDLKALGFDVYDTSQPFRALITPGLPDLLVHGVVPSLSSELGPYTFMVAIETKAEKGRQSTAQKLFQRRWEAAGYVYILGGRAEVRAWLLRIGAALDHPQTGEWTIRALVVGLNRDRAKAERAAGLRAVDE